MCTCSSERRIASSLSASARSRDDEMATVFKASEAAVVLAANEKDGAHRAAAEGFFLRVGVHYYYFAARAVLGFCVR